jgi:hypothetical protein
MTISDTTQGFAVLDNGEQLAGKDTTTMSNSFEVIDLSEVVVARRGAEATYDDALLGALAALKAGEALAATPLTVNREDFKSEDAFKNAKQTVGASIRKHWDHLKVTGEVGADQKIRINWHPATGAPQISIKG